MKMYIKCINTNVQHKAQTQAWLKVSVRDGMKVIRHAGVDSRMIILDDQTRQQMTLHFQLSLQCNVSPITGFVRHTAKKKKRVATYILVLWAMIGQDSMHV